MSEPLIELVEVTKAFGATLALDSVSFDVSAGEVHVLAGENGAGKSTLIKILSGAIRDFSGRLVVRAPVSAIHQELSLVGPMSVADNLALPGQTSLLQPRRPRADREKARRVLVRAGIGDVDPEAAVETLPIAVRQQIEIARALEQRAGVIVMDEPTSALGETEAERLLARVRELARLGTAIVYISHRMEEIFRVADRITVLRDGRRVLSAPAAELDRDQLIRAMLGRSLAAPMARSARPDGEVALEARDLTLFDPRRPGRRLLDRVSFTVQRGEIVGIFGSLGSGASIVLHTIFGMHGAPDGGAFWLEGQSYAPAGPRRAIAAGVMLLASDRKLTVFADLGVGDNVTLSSSKRWSWLGGGRARKAAAEAMLATLGVRGLRGLRDPAGWLSGGNQQKVALARCLLADPRVLLLDEPTRGVDVGAKSDVHARVIELAARGIAIVLVTSELEELCAISSRVLVMHRGRIVDELRGEQIRRERIALAAMGAARPEAP